jgi:hypothetical protein
MMSVIVPVRERVTLLDKMLTSLFATAQEHVEVVLRIDVDDEDMWRYLYQRDWPYPYVVGPRYKGYATLSKFINEAARLSRGDLVLVINDDAEFVTPSWDTKLAAIAEQYSDGIFDLGVETANADNFIFPCVSRHQINLLGGVFDERLVYPDIWLRDVMLPFGRAVRVHDVEIKHNWAGQSDDQIKAGQQVHGSTSYMQLYDECVREGREQIEQVLCVGSIRRHD